MLEPVRLVEIIAERCRDDREAIVAFWCQCLVDRREYCDDLRRKREQLPLVPVVVNGRRFSNPNGLSNDLFEVLAEQREECERVGNWSDVERTNLVLVLLSRTPLGIPIISSPLVTPDWFPLRSGENVVVRIEDIARSPLGSLRSPEIDSPGLCVALFRLEDALVRRLKSRMRTAEAEVEKFFEGLRDEREKWAGTEAFLTRACRLVGAVESPEGFRPGARDADFLIGRIMRLVPRTSPDGLVRCARLFAAALDVPEEARGRPRGEALVSVLLRPTVPITSGAVRFARNILLGVYATEQLVTGEAHAGEYGRYPLMLLKSTSEDLRAALTTLAEDVELLSVTPS